MITWIWIRVLQKYPQILWVFFFCKIVRAHTIVQILYANRTIPLSHPVSALIWTVYWVFKLITGKEGMGYGDFKLFAALGAWFGWQALVPIILMASIIGALVGIAMKFSNGLREGGYVPFGPFLAGAGLTAMVFGPNAILRTIGL